MRARRFDGAFAVVHALGAGFGRANGTGRQNLSIQAQRSDVVSDRCKIDFWKTVTLQRVEDMIQASDDGRSRMPTFIEPALAGLYQRVDHLRTREGARS